MSKFDRCIFISIAIGIWALAMTQVFKPQILQAGKMGNIENNGTLVFANCPRGVNNTQYNESTGKLNNIGICSYLLVATYDDLRENLNYFQ
jgi:hypothetical protein